MQTLTKVLLPAAQADHRARRQPDDDGRAVHGHDRRADRRARARQDGREGVADRRRRHGVQRGPRDRRAGDRARPGHHRGGRPPSARDRPQPVAALVRRGLGGGALTGVGVYLSYTYVWAAEFPPDVEIGRTIAQGTPPRRTGCRELLPVITDGIKDFVTLALINPLQTLLTESPWFLVARDRGGVRGDRLGPGGDRLGRVPASAVATGLWQDAMSTLASTLVATSMVMVLGVVVGVWMGRSGRWTGSSVRCWTRPDDAAVRLPGAVPGAVRREPVHRDRRGRGVRRTGDDQDRRGRHPRGVDRRPSRRPRRSGRARGRRSPRCSCRWRVRH